MTGKPTYRHRRSRASACQSVHDGPTASELFADVRACRGIPQENEVRATVVFSAIDN